LVLDLEYYYKTLSKKYGLMSRDDSRLILDKALTENQAKDSRIIFGLAQGDTFLHYAFVERMYGDVKTTPYKYERMMSINLPEDQVDPLMHAWGIDTLHNGLRFVAYSKLDFYTNLLGVRKNPKEPLDLDLILDKIAFDEKLKLQEN